MGRVQSLSKECLALGRDESVDRALHRLPATRSMATPPAEALFTGEEASLRQLFALVGAPLPPTGRIERVLGKHLNAQRTGAFPLPDEWTGAMRAELRAMAGDTAQALGYDLTEPL